MTRAEEIAMKGYRSPRPMSEAHKRRIKNLGRTKKERLWEGELSGFMKTERAGWGPTEQFLKSLDAK